jgi:hypothetical protein
MKLHSISLEDLQILNKWDPRTPFKLDKPAARDDAWMKPEQKAANAQDPNLIELTGGRKNLATYEGQLISRQIEAIAAWKQTDNYRYAYLKKKKKKRPILEWAPKSREYQNDATTEHFLAPMFASKVPEPPPKSPEPYRSSEYKKETKKTPAVPLPEGQKSAYKSLEYQKACPVPPTSFPGVPFGNNPAEGPWVEVFDSMWNSSWVTIKDLDLGEASDKIA